MGGMAQGQTTITQCDLKRTIQINDSARKYIITPMATDESDASGAVVDMQPAVAAAQRGGIVTMTVNTVDTGERKEMFGFTARHLKRTTMMESGPGACSQQKMKIETDGWYINLEYGLACETASPATTDGRHVGAGLPRSLSVSPDRPDEHRVSFVRNHHDVRRRRLCQTLR